MFRQNGFSLIEIIVVVAIFGIVLASIFSSITASRQGWERGAQQIDRQQEARKAVDRIVWELKESNPFWNITEGPYAGIYPVFINSLHDRMDFYLPVFVDNEIANITPVHYYIGGLNNAQLLRRGVSDTVVVANNINNVDSQKPFFSFVNPPDNTLIDIRIPIIKNNDVFVLTSQANLRNRQPQLDEEVVVEQIPEE